KNCCGEHEESWPRLYRAHASNPQAWFCSSRRLHADARRWLQGFRRYEIRRRAIIYHRRGFGFTQDRQVRFEIIRASATLTGNEIELEIAVACRDLSEGFAGGSAQWRATKIRVQNNPGAVYHRLQARMKMSIQRAHDVIEHVFEGNELVRFAQRRKLSPNDGDDNGTRKIDMI